MNGSRLARIASVAAILGTMLAGLVAAVPVLAAPPANDNSGGAVPIGSLPVQLTTVMAEATADAEDPARCQQDPTGMVSVWYRLDLTYPTDRWVGLLPGSTDTDSTRVRVLDSPGGMPLTDCNTNDAWFVARPGHSYWVVVLALIPSGGPGPVDVSLVGWVATEAPPNDLASHATVVSKFPFDDAMDMAGATHSANDPPTCNGPGTEQGVSNIQTIWYRLDYPYSRRHRVGIRVNGPAYNGFWVVGSPGGHVITCADNPTGDGAHTYFVAEPGHTYWIVVGKGASEHAVSEPTTITIRATRVDLPPPTDNSLPNTSTASSAPTSIGVGDGSPWQLVLLLLAGALAFALVAGRHRPGSTDPSEVTPR
jgi:hypothetical protein